MAISIGAGSYEVRFDPGTANTDITKFIVSVDSMTDVGTGEVNSATITLNADQGGFISNASVEGVNSTPILDQWGKIKITLTDKNSNSYSRIFEVETTLPQKAIGGGNLLKVEMFGQEHNLKDVHFGKQYFFADAFSTSKDIIDRYNGAGGKGTAQAAVELHDNQSNNKMPEWTSNNFEFNVSEQTCYDGLMEIVDRMGSSVSAGGAADFFGLTFIDKSGDDTVIQVKLAPSGDSLFDAQGGNITVTNANVTPLQKIDGIREAQTGTVLVAKGAQGFGSYPVDFSKFRSEVELFDFHPVWQPDLPYKTNAFIKYTHTDNVERHYERTGADLGTGPNNNPEADAGWTRRTKEDVLGSSKYSTWTDNLFNEWKNSGSAMDLSGASFDKRGCWDSNLVIRDKDHFRTWVQERVFTDEVAATAGKIPVEYSYGGVGGKMYRGFRVLVDSALGALAGAFATNSNRDRAGLLYDKNIAQHNGGVETGSNAYKNWDILRGRVSADKDQAAVIGEGIVYEYTLSTTTWADASATARANDCFHIYFSCTAAQGASEIPKGGGDYGDTSGVKYIYEYTPWTALAAAADIIVPNYYSIGAWACFRVPFPHNTYNTVSTIGDKFGNSTSPFEPATIDANNFHLDHTGGTGFNQDNAEDFAPFTTLELQGMIDYIVVSTGNGVALQADFKIRCTCYDTSDNVVIQDFTIPHRNNFFHIPLPLTGFKIYRARASRRWGDVLTNLFPPELEILEQFEWKNLCMISIQTQDSYDSEGRYFPENGRYVLGLPLGSDKRVQLTIDSYRFGKQLTAFSGKDTTRCIQPRFLQRPNTTNYVQLKQDVLSQLEIEQFRLQGYNIEQEMLCDIAAEEAFFLEDSIVVDRADRNETSAGANDGDANTIKLINKKTVYSVNAPDGPGGMIRIVEGVKRFET